MLNCQNSRKTMTKIFCCITEHAVRFQPPSTKLLSSKNFRNQVVASSYAHRFLLHHRVRKNVRSCVIWQPLCVFSGTDEEKVSALETLWMLSFSEQNQDAMRALPSLLESLEKAQNSSNR